MARSRRNDTLYLVYILLQLYQQVIDPYVHSSCSTCGYRITRLQRLLSLSCSLESTFLASMISSSTSPVRIASLA